MSLILVLFSLVPSCERQAFTESVLKLGSESVLVYFTFGYLSGVLGKGMNTVRSRIPTRVYVKKRNAYFGHTCCYCIIAFVIGFMASAVEMA